jgi:hypothetical protein
VHSKDQRIKQSTFATNPSFHHIIPYATRDTRIIKVQGRSYPPSRPMPGCMFATSPFNCSITHAEYANFLVEHCRLHASLTTVTLITQTLPSACRISSLLKYTFVSIAITADTMEGKGKGKGKEKGTRIPAVDESPNTNTGTVEKSKPYVRDSQASRSTVHTEASSSAVCPKKLKNTVCTKTSKNTVCTKAANRSSKENTSRRETTAYNIPPIRRLPSNLRVRCWWPKQHNDPEMPMSIVDVQTIINKIRKYANKMKGEDSWDALKPDIWLPMLQCMCTGACKAVENEREHMERDLNHYRSIFPSEANVLRRRMLGNLLIN